MPSIHKLHQQYGGDGIPFSKVTSKRTHRRMRGGLTPKKKNTKKKKKLTKTKRRVPPKKKCICKKHPKHSKDDSPNGLGKCAECKPLHIIIKGKNKKYWENKSVNGKHTWIQVF